MSESDVSVGGETLAALIERLTAEFERAREETAAAIAAADNAAEKKARLGRQLNAARSLFRELFGLELP